MHQKLCNMILAGGRPYHLFDCAQIKGALFMFGNRDKPGYRKTLACFFGFHKPSPYVKYKIYGKQFMVCSQCGKVLDERK